MFRVRMILIEKSIFLMDFTLSRCSHSPLWENMIFSMLRKLQPHKERQLRLEMGE